MTRLNLTFMPLFSSLHQSMLPATLRRRAVQYLSFNRNLLPMFPSVGQL